MKYKGFPLEIKSLDESGLFEGYAAIFDIEDEGGDIIERGAFKKTLKEQKSFPIWYNHEYKFDPTALPIGVHMDGHEDDHGLFVKGHLNLDIPRAREVYSLVKQGAIRKMSIGYMVVKHAYQGHTRRLKELKLGEYSLVPFPMQEHALVTGVKSMDLFEKLGVKAADFNATLTQALQKQELRSLRWKIEDALSDVISNVLSDSEMDAQTKVDTISVSLDQYKTMMLSWVERTIALTAGSPVKSDIITITSTKRSVIDTAAKSLIALLEGTEPDDSTQESGEPQDNEGKSLDFSHLLSQSRLLGECLAEK